MLLKFNHHARVLVTILAASIGLLAFAQDRTQKVAVSADEENAFHVPSPLLYRHFFKLLKSRDNASEQIVGRQYYQKQIGLSDEQFAKVTNACDEVNSVVAQFDARANAIISQYRAELKTPHSRATPPPIPDELKHLSRERDRYINRSLADLKNSLGKVDSERLDKAVSKMFTIKAVSPTAAISSQADVRDDKTR